MNFSALRGCCLVVIYMLIAMHCAAQEAGAEKSIEQGLKGTHRITVLIGHSHLSQGIMETGKRGWKVIPSWAIDYDYWISHHWALGWQNDIMIETFEVEGHNNKVIKRTRPVSSIATVLFKPREHVVFIAGAGGEFAKEGSYFVTRLGLESGWELKNNWEFGVSLAYDIKWNGYDNWVIGFGISKLLKRHSR